MKTWSLDLAIDAEEHCSLQSAGKTRELAARWAEQEVSVLVECLAALGARSWLATFGSVSSLPGGSLSRLAAGVLMAEAPGKNFHCSLVAGEEGGHSVHPEHGCCMTWLEMH